MEEREFAPAPRRRRSENSARAACGGTEAAVRTGAGREAGILHPRTRPGREGKKGACGGARLQPLRPGPCWQGRPARRAVGQGRIRAHFCALGGRIKILPGRL